MGGSCLTPSSCFGGGRRSPSAPRTPPRASRSDRVRSGIRSGQRPRHRATGNAACGARRSPDPPCARRASEQHREQPPPPPTRPLPGERATLHNRARRSASEAGGGGRWTSPPNLPSFPSGAFLHHSRSSNVRFSLSSSALNAQVQPWWKTRPPPTHPTENMKTALPPISWGCVVLPNLQFGGRGRREQCLAWE